MKIVNWLWTVKKKEYTEYRKEEVEQKKVTQMNDLPLSQINKELFQQYAKQGSSDSLRQQLIAVSLYKWNKSIPFDAVLGIDKNSNKQLNPTWRSFVRRGEAYS